MRAQNKRMAASQFIKLLAIRKRVRSIKANGFCNTKDVCSKQVGGFF